MTTRPTGALLRAPCAGRSLFNASGRSIARACLSARICRIVIFPRPGQFAETLWEEKMVLAMRPRFPALLTVDVQ
jgi:hypothetical protein